MSVLTPEVVDILMNLSCPLEEKTALMKALVRAGQAFTPPHTTNGVNEERERLRNESTYQERKRKNDRERRAREREELRQLKASGGESPATTTATTGEAQRGDDDRARPAGDYDGDPATPRARVRDITPKLVNNSNLTTPDGECAWPETNPPSRVDLDRLEAALRQAAGASLNATAPRLFDLSPILRLSRQGQGPACDLQADVIPTIRARSARAPPGSVKSWDFFRDAITEARDRRLSGAPASEPRHDRTHATTAPTERTDRLGRMLRGAMAAVDEHEHELERRRSRPGH